MGEFLEEGLILTHQELFNLVPASLLLGAGRAIGRSKIREN